MEGKLSSVAKNFTPSPIQELSQLAQRCNAINLAEGFPDFPAPPCIKEAAVSAINNDFNQYRHVQGICDQLALKMKKTHGLNVNPLTDIAICCGQSEAFAAAIFSIINQGDEVLLFDPCYETYEGCITLAGGIPVYVALEPPQWTLDPEKLMRSFTSRTKAIVLNRSDLCLFVLPLKFTPETFIRGHSPHNPTGKVFSRDELEIIAEGCRRWDCVAITDEVYEYITYDNQKHETIAKLPGMQERTIITSSLSKTFSVTGWRIGWAIAPASAASAIQNIHIRITDSAPAPFQEAALTALRSPNEYFETLRGEYELKRDFCMKLLSSVGFRIQFKPQGSLFLFAELPKDCLLSDVEYVEELIKQAGVVVVPGRGFFHGNESCKYQKRYIRVAFCKSGATLNAAAQKFGELINAKACPKIFY
ncbi:kynurenine--oxoglutarate transaminase-like [Gossypium australe]|uniref:Kynurenine--oxoglutarate transaminase-like n=1 Tax=Gossypium australe TaxID=47621 RepID=A0A5B6UEK5_9ROSI|nr:kynurenine--oxoglutarate transaminase-like [Gossypium australe]